MARTSTALFTTIVSSTHKLSLAALLLGCISAPSLAASVKSTTLAGPPTVNEDKITVRIRVKDLDERPVVGLLDTNFKLQVDGKELLFKSKDWKSPQDAVPPPAWIIVLLDMSGSMGKPDSRGTTKLKGALEAIKQFKNTISERTTNVSGENVPQIAIVPFGKPGPKCAGFPVGQGELEKFFLANDFKLQNHLDFLAAQVPCAATNLYEPLSKENDPRFYLPEKSPLPKPRLSIILLSDGYHTEAHESEDFDTLKLLMRQHPDIMVHTLGYGLTLDELGKKYNLGRPANRQDITWADSLPKPSPQVQTTEKTSEQKDPTAATIKDSKDVNPLDTKEIKIPKGKVSADEFVDQERLKEIAQLSGGISEFSGDAETVSAKLQVFLNALLGEYEISYIQPNADRGSKHDVKAIVGLDNKNVESNPESYTIPVFGRTLPFPVRAGVLLSTFLLMGVGGVVPFIIWANKLKQEDN
jgi:hypothetical protein